MTFIPVILTKFATGRMADFGFSEEQALALIQNSKLVEFPGEMIKGNLKSGARYLQNGIYFFQIIPRGKRSLVIGVNVISFTNHARERIHSFKLSEEDVVNYMLEAIEDPQAMMGRTRRSYKQIDNKEKTYKYGPFVFGITEDRSDWIVATVFDQRLTLPNYDPNTDPFHK